MDVTQHTKAKSDQLNADDLLGGPITVQIQSVVQGSAEQPVTVKLAGGHMPWKPCKTSLRILAFCWGAEADAWRGRWVQLYRDDSVKFGGANVGGIRVAGLSHIERPQVLNLAVTRGKKQQHTIRPLSAQDTGGGSRATADLDKLLSDEGLTRAQVDAWLASIGKPSLDSQPEKWPDLAAHIAGSKKVMAAIRAFPASAENAPPKDWSHVGPPPMTDAEIEQ